MRTFVVAALASILAVAQARINGFQVPRVIKPGDGFNLIVESSNYIQSVYDVAFAVGCWPGKTFTGSLGTVMGSYYLGPEQSNQLHNFPKWTVLPADTPKGPAVIVASFQSLYGAGKFPTLETHNVSVIVGDTTSTTYVSSLG